ncbi:hypothetical protein PYW08_011224 [Mythimna loreyi]|uniref:Uncharacterized protein n=1 Tax=Mythimna loreyi TaxID=667449 RepID=A0ACC2Q306_9NEOP|nr:hypothetical protein PYW08_011224 [Mythimna loreyi]
MLRNPKYVYGPQNVTVPADLNFGDYFLTRIWEHRHKIALINGITDEPLTYGDIVQQAMNFAVSLTRMGVRKGDTIGLMSENRHEFWGAVVGVACAGAVLTTISTGYVKGEILHVTSISKPKYIICSPVMYKLHEKTLKSLNFVKNIILFGEEKQHSVLMYNDLVFEDNGQVKNVKFEEFQSVEVQGQTDTLAILYSSGTTGLPKGVMLTHLNVIAVCCMPPTADASVVALTITPWYHVMGLVGMLSAFITGRTAVYLAKFDVDTYLKTVDKYRTVLLTVVPPILVAICKNQSNYDLSSVKLIYSGAAPLHKDTINSVHEKFPNLEGVHQGYGATEMTLAVTKSITGNTNTHKFGSVGVVVPNTVVKVTDLETGKPLGPNERGEICAKGVLLMKGYVGKSRGSDFDDEGFYRTGDVGYYDEDRYFFIVDRVKELIKYKGYQVPPAELEAVLLQHEGIRDAAVIGVEHRTAGEVPLAFVVAQPGKTLTEAEVKEFVAERLSNPKHLRGGVRFVQQIPKSASGKLLRKELRKMLKTAKSRL